MKKSTQVAIGGLSAALCLLMMFMTGLIPFSSYIFPAAAGIVLIAVFVEMGIGTAMLVYVVVSFLSLLIVPDREAVLLFIMLLGYYPMIKTKIERLPRILAYLLKFVFVNCIIVAFYYVTLYVLGIPDLIEGWGDFGRYTVYIALGGVNFTFFTYDFLLTQVLFIYRSWFRPKILRKLF